MIWSVFLFNIFVSNITMTISHPEDLTEFRKIVKDNQYVILDFSAKWCGPCKAIAPKFEQMSNNVNFSKWKFLKVDVDDNQDISDMFGISSLPTFIFIKDGTPVSTITGVNEKQIMENLSSL